MHRLFLLLIATASLWAEGGAGDPDGSSSGSSSGTGPTPGGETPEPGLGPYLPFIIIGVVLFMIMSMGRKQKKQEREKQAAIAALKIGDKVVTVGGLCGVVTRIGEDSLDLRTGSGEDGSLLTFTKAAVHQVLQDGDKPGGETDKKEG